MPVRGWMVTGLDVAAVSLLLNAGIAKLVAADPPLRALGELLPLLDGRLGSAAIRAFAAAELAVAVGLLVPALRPGGAAAAAALGIGFMVLGAVGLLRRSGVPCGCLGGSGGWPLGWVNVGLGIGLALAGLVTLAGAGAASGGDASAAVPLASIGTIALCLGLHRRLIVQLLLPARGARALGEAG